MEVGEQYPYAYMAVMVLLYSALMTAVYILTVAIRAWFPDRGKELHSNEKITDPNWEMKLPLGLFAITVLVFGVCSEPLMQVFRAVVQGTF